MTVADPQQRLAAALQRIYNRPERPRPWQSGGNLPWDEPEFSKRMLREHLDQSHSAASRTQAQLGLVLEWLWRKLALAAGQDLLDVTCGPGLYAVPLAARGLRLTGVDFAPATLAYAREQAAARGVADQCRFVQADVRAFDFGEVAYDAALLLYGQLAVMQRHETADLLARIGRALRPGGRLCLELLDQDQVDKEDSNWWFTDDSGLWGDRPFLHLGERIWYEAQQLSLERFYILDLESAGLTEVQLCDQTYATAEMVEMLRQAGFAAVDVYPHWDDVLLYDAPEWIVYVAQKAGE